MSLPSPAIDLRQRWIQIQAVGVLAVGLVATACAAPDPEVALAMSDFTFEPAQMTIERGKKTVFVLRNQGAVEHRFAIPKQTGVAPAAVGPGQTVKLEVALPPGSFQYICEIHEKSGMVGQLTAARTR